jgi:hypothetical protein
MWFFYCNFFFIFAYKLKNRNLFFMENKVEIPYDIIFLLKRLDIVISREEYEKAHIINKWIKELVTFYKVEEVYYLNF